MSSLPPRIVVRTNQYALAADVIALQYLEAAYHNMIAASNVGCSEEGLAGVLADARGNGAVVSGCNVKFDPVSGNFGILNGTVVMFNNVIDNSDNPTLPLYPFSQSLVAVLAQTIPAPTQVSQPGWAVIYLKKQDYTFSQIRDFLNPSTGGTSPQTTEVLFGAIGVANITVAHGT